MGWHDKDITEIYQIVEMEHQAAQGSNGSGGMQAQSEAWSKLQQLFTWQHQNLTKHRKALAAKWTSPGATYYLDQVDKVIDTLYQAASVAYGNSVALANMKGSLDTNYPIIKQAYEDYRRELSSQLDKYNKQLDDINTAKRTLGFGHPLDDVKALKAAAGYGPKLPDQTAIAKPYLAKACAAANALSNDYAQNNAVLLANPPAYNGPTAPVIDRGDGATDASALVSAGMPAPAGPLLGDARRVDDRTLATKTPPSPGTDPGPILAGGAPPSAPVTHAPTPPAPTPTTGPPSGRTLFGPFPGTNAPVSESVSAEPFGQAVPRTGRIGVPDEEFMPRARATTPVLGDADSKVAARSTSRNQYGELDGELPEGRGRVPSILGNRSRKFAESEERAKPGLTDPDETVVEEAASRGGSVLGEPSWDHSEPPVGPVAEPGPLGRSRLTASERQEGKILGQGDASVLPAATDRNPNTSQHRNDRRSDGGAWDVDESGDGVIGFEPEPELPMDEGSPIGGARSSRRDRR
jgi:hypothetical protein